MKTSDSILQIAPAFAKAQPMFQPPIKDKTADAGKFGYSYADLANVFDGARPGLTANALFLVQNIVSSESGKRELETVLMHESGEYFAMSYPINMTGTPQQVGSEITYARRYSAMMMLGLAGEDDDGAAASNKKPGVQPAQKGSSATTTQATTTQNASKNTNVARLDGTHSSSSDPVVMADETVQDIEGATLRINAIAFKKRWTDRLIASITSHPEHAALYATVAKANEASNSTPTAEIIARAKRIMVNVCNTTGQIEESAPGE